MPVRKLLFITALLVIAICAYLLITGSPLLLRSLADDIYVPLGTFITWIGLIALPLSIYIGVDRLYSPRKKNDRYISKMLILFIILCSLWMPVYYGLAGNISFSFSEKTTFQGGQTAMKIFWIFTYTLVAGPLILLIVYWINNLFRNRKASAEI
jgi:hypothetical protein